MLRLGTSLVSEAQRFVVLISIRLAVMVHLGGVVKELYSHRTWIDFGSEREVAEGEPWFQELHREYLRNTTRFVFLFHM